jgi:hypothetical protein
VCLSEIAGEYYTGEWFYGLFMKGFGDFFLMAYLAKIIF